MYTLCPKCKHSQQISRKQLKKKRGQLNCSNCKQVFDAQATLSKTPPPKEPKVSALLPEAQIPELSTLLKSHNQTVEGTEIAEESETSIDDSETTEESEISIDDSETAEEFETSTDNSETAEKSETSTDDSETTEESETPTDDSETTEKPEKPEAPTETPKTIKESESESENEIYAWQKTRSPYRPERWLFASMAGLALLVYQFYYFEGYSLSQSRQFRPWLSALSSAINYPLADYRNPLEFTTVGSSFTPINKKHYRLQVSLINHADFRQPPPYLQLTLQNFYGGIFAQRIFSPQDYLGQTTAVMPIDSSAPLDIDFLIANPEQDIGGYRIELK